MQSLTKAIIFTVVVWIAVVGALVVLILVWLNNSLFLNNLFNILSAGLRAVLIVVTFCWYAKKSHDNAAPCTEDNYQPQPGRLFLIGVVETLLGLIAFPMVFDFINYLLFHANLSWYFNLFSMFPFLILNVVNKKRISAWGNITAIILCTITWLFLMYILLLKAFA